MITNDKYILNSVTDYDTLLIILLELVMQAMSKLCRSIT